MEIFKEYLTSIASTEQRARMEEILNWVSEKFSHLAPKFAWNQPMFTDHDTFIIGFSVSKGHISVSPEKRTMAHFSPLIEEYGYAYSTNLFRIKWSEPEIITTRPAIPTALKFYKLHVFWQGYCHI